MHVTFTLIDVSIMYFLRKDDDNWVETRLRTFLEFMFAHIYHLRTKKYHVWAHLEIDVFPRSLLKTSLYSFFAAVNVYHLLILTGERLILI